jgi:flagellar basal body-associated protein FliL
LLFIIIFFLVVIIIVNVVTIIIFFFKLPTKNKKNRHTKLLPVMSNLDLSHLPNMMCCQNKHVLL